MSEKLPAVEGADFCTRSSVAGFAVVRIKGSAHIMRHADGRMVSVYVHKGATIKRGTLAGILDDAGLSADDLRDVL
jgi:predicted RNA binding protein YcfA (HicA-like mRNA interferase family)